MSKSTNKRVIKSQTTSVELEGLLEGFTVTWKKSISVSLMRRLIEISKDLDNEDAELEELSTEEQTLKTEESIKNIEEIIDILAPRLVDWDLADESGDIPATKKGLLDLDLDFLMELFTSFCGVVGELPKAQN